MNKNEAIELMKKGVKITQVGFSKHEWMTMEKGNIVLEDGVVCSTYEFWRWRTEDYWNEGYSIFKEIN